MATGEDVVLPMGVVELELDDVDEAGGVVLPGDAGVVVLETATGLVVVEPAPFTAAAAPLATQ